MEEGREEDKEDEKKYVKEEGVMDASAMSTCVLTTRTQYTAHIRVLSLAFYSLLFYHHLPHTLQYSLV